MNWPAAMKQELTPLLIVAGSIAIGAFGMWYFNLCPKMVPTVIDRSAAVADSLTIVDLTAALIRRDSLDHIKDSLIANREPVYIRIHDNFQSLRSTGNTDAARAALSRDPVTRLGSSASGHDTLMGGETDDR